MRPICASLSSLKQVIKRPFYRLTFSHYFLYDLKTMSDLYVSRDVAEFRVVKEIGPNRKLQSGRLFDRTIIDKTVHKVNPYVARFQWSHNMM